ncbi:hypothetical protein [Acinetobacter phage HFM1]|nr:hypothetical protein [Acinetobacter phage HFM1]
MFKNMKISITDDEHLKAVCDVLESMGYSQDGKLWSGFGSFTQTVCCNIYGEMMDLVGIDVNYDRLDKYELVTLSDLLKMRDDMVKEKARLNSQQN